MIRRVACNGELGGHWVPPLRWLGVAWIVLAVSGVACTVGGPTEHVPLVAGEGITVTASASRRVVAVDPAVVPIVPECATGDIVTRGSAGEWACSPEGPAAETIRWAGLRNVPDGFADGRDDDGLAALSCPAGAFLAGAGGGNWDCTSALRSDADIPWSRLEGMPEHLADGRDDDALGALTSSCSDGQIAKWSSSGRWTCAGDDVPTEAEVDAWVAGSPLDLRPGSTVGGQPISIGAHTSSLAWPAVTSKPAAWADGTDDDTLAQLGCAGGQVARAERGRWICDEDAAHDQAAVRGRARALGYAAASAVQALADEVAAARDTTTDLGARIAAEEARWFALEASLDTVAPPAGYVRIDPGTFTMGSPFSEPGRNGDEAQHQVTITRPFWLKATEVTQGQWRQVASAEGWSPVDPSRFLSCGDDCPVQPVNWYEAVAYANARSRSEGLPRCYSLSGCNAADPGSGLECSGVAFVGLSCAGYRLPTEAEWEYAARAGTTTAFFSGTITSTGCGPDPNLNLVAWYCGNNAVTYGGCANTSNWGGAACAGTHPVAQKRPNPWGLYDLHGNVEEWVHDWFLSFEAFAGTSTVNPIGPATGTYRVGRGGDWYHGAIYCRSASRMPVSPHYRGVEFGFRVARTIP